MASRSVSPGGALLRASRVFAIPPPLPRPAVELSSTTIFYSPTATTPHPTRLSITTPPSSLKRGDWGFKRPLPLRSTTRTTTPLIRVEAIDSYDQVTDFVSSADHTITLRKWQEMGIPLTVPVVDENSGSFTNDKRRSVFEDDADYTAKPKGPSLGKGDIRWKFKGPFLPNQSEGDFQDYIKNHVRKRRNEFKGYLKIACASALTAEARAASTGEMPAAISAKNVTEKQLAAFVKELRLGPDRFAISKLIRDFLDLPPMSPPSGKQLESLFDDLGRGIGSRATAEKLGFSATQSPYGDSGPPKMHPSAGLGYARTSAFTPNHPQFGPQMYPAPLQARVVRPKGASGGSFAPTLGVGGIVVDIPFSATSFDMGNTSKDKRGNRLAMNIPGVQEIDPDIVGGSKTYVHPMHAHINPKGNIIVKVGQGDPAAIAVLEGTTDKIPKPASSPVGPGGTARTTRIVGSPYYNPGAASREPDAVQKLSDLI